jgi:hypothetical protein
MADDDECTYQVWLSEASVAEIKRLLDPDYLTRAGCRVVKHPDCCVLCAMNNDCSRIPLHYNCLIGSTRVAVPVVPADVAVWIASQDALGAVGSGVQGGLATAAAVTATERDFGRANVRAVSVREYVGDVVTIRTASGNELTGTPNHPIATRHGWVALAELRVGDHVLRSLRPEWEVNGVNPDVDDIPPPIEQVAQTFPVRLDPVPTSAEDFHTDGAGSEVHVVLTDGLLMSDVESLCAEHLAELDLGGGTFADALEFAGAGAGLKGGVGPLSSTDSVVGGGAELGPLLRRRLRHAHVHGVTSATGGDTGVVEPTLDSWPADAEGFCERLDALATDVAADEITDLDRRMFHGHVYNLETVGGWYVSNSIITHNCRCRPEGYLELEIQ